MKPNLLLLQIIGIILPSALHSFVINNNVSTIRSLSSYKKQKQQNVRNCNTSICNNQKNDNDSSSSSNPTTRIISKEAQDLLDKAKRIRESLGENEQRTSTTANTTTVKRATKPKSNFNVQSYDNDVINDSESIGYRLYLDIGREEGTWMDPRWGASGKRIECTIDISFLLPPTSLSSSSSSSQASNNEDLSLANEEIMKNMVKDNLSGKSSPVRIVQTAPKARLRNGFDEMNTYSGGYRIDVGGSNKSSNTVRFYLSVDGTESSSSSSSYGDINIPEGNLYFSLPCFGTDVKALSSKEGIVTVRQFGWHTGWRREESRIVGVFRAVPIDKATRMDGF